MSKPALSLTTLPELAGWMTLGEAAQALGVSTERIRQMATSSGAGRLKTAHQIGKRPIGVVREAEITEILARRAAAQAAGAALPEDVPAPDAGNLRASMGYSGHYVPEGHPGAFS